MIRQPTWARAEGPGQQVVHVTVAGGYQPAEIIARANVPLRLIFHRQDADACTERVVFSSPKLERHLLGNAPTAVDLPAQPPGEVRFTCGMGRYRGLIQLVDDRYASLLGRLRARLSAWVSRTAQ